jgi:exodeoxyribonuclease V beta subunit
VTTRILDPLAVALRGTHLVEASAGTGKTHAIATLYVRLVAELGHAVDRILVVTFTEAAAAELRDRIRKRLRAARAALDDAAALPARRLDLAIRTFDEAAISTIHGFCHRVLHDSAFETGVAFDTELVANQQPLLDLAVRDFWARELYDADARFVAHLVGRKLAPPKLLELATKAASHPHVPLLPRRHDVEKQPDVAPFLGAFGRARQLWLEDRPRIEALLVEHEGFKVGRYPPAELAQWCRAMDAYLGRDDPGTSLTFGQLRKFTTQHITDSTLKRFVDRGDVPTHPFFDACGELEQAAAPLASNFDVRVTELKRALCRFVWRELPRRKRAAGVQSFDDLLHDLDRALQRRPGGKELAEAIRGRYAAALIDEFQDTDPVQYRIFSAIYGGTELPLFLIGDPKQAIYGFRGADVFAYLAAATKVRPQARHTMNTNWRSDPDLLAAIEHLFAVRRPFYLEGIDFVPVGPRPGASPRLRVDGEPLPAFEIAFQLRDGTGARSGEAPIPGPWALENLPRRVAADIAALLHSKATIDGRTLHAGDIAVLSRTNRQAQAVQAALRDFGIPGVVYGDASVFDSSEAGDLERVLAAVAEPTAVGLMRAAITTELLGVSAGELLAMTENDDASWDHWVQSFRRWNATWIERGFIQMFRQLMGDAGLQRRLLRLADGERRMTNLLHLAELLHTAASTQHLGPAGLLHWLEQQRRVDQTLSEAVKLRLERDDEAVQLITVHRAKGLEYPVVYCPFLWSADDLRNDEIDNLLFHDADDGNRLKLDIGIKPGKKEERLRLANVARAQFETSAESLRLLYVALTRARHRVVVYWGRFDRGHRSALGYLLHAPSLGTDWGWDPELVASNIRRADDAKMLATLRARAHPTWSIRMLDDAEGRRWSPTPVSAAGLRARTPRATVDRFHRTSSFTQMAGSHVVDPSEGRDHDQGRDAQAGPPVQEDGPKVALADFPRGATVGNFFHDVLEHIEFAVEYAQLRPVVEQKLRTWGVAGPGWADTVTRALLRILACPIDEEGLCLRDIAAGDRLCELPFVMPVAAQASTPEVAIDRHALVRAFTSESRGLPAGYAAKLEQLGFVPLRGFLKGFVDLVFRHGERWYLVDYKTNHLGDTAAAYSNDAMLDVMRSEHYVLQYHLYTVALVRHLELRVRDFDYDRHFGGVLYLFLRGMPEGVGVFRDLPPRGRIEALSRVFDRGAGA